MTDKKNFNSSFFYNDKDSEAMYSKIVDLLVVAGYFRARIQSLEPFDKILGGIVWTLTGSFTDVDIEFKEEMNITEKM
jgi:hypothetical protein